jgi:arylsulfatase A-like enzyme
MRGFLDAVQKRFGPLPNRHALPASRWTSYFTQVITLFVLPELAPTLLVFWHTDPDHTTHALGYSAAETRQALRDADANLGAVLRAYAERGLLESTAVVVTSDHGGSTIRRRFQPARDLAGVLSNGAAAENGGSVFVYSSDPSAVTAIRQFEYVGPVFTADGRDGTFPLSLVGLAGPRAPDIVFSFVWSDDPVGGVPGTAFGCASKLVMDHGSISPFDLHNTLVLNGPSFRIGFRNMAPVGNIDVCPTLCHVLGIPPDPGVDGRILHETLRDPAAEAEWDTVEEVREFAARNREWRQRVWFERTNSTAYLAGGTVEPL